MEPGYVVPSRRDTCSQCGKVVQRSHTSADVIVCLVCKRKTAGRGPSAPARKKSSVEWSPQVLECRICGEDFTQNHPRQVYCSTACRESRSNWRSYDKTASAEERGYGKAHRDERAKWKPLVDAGQVSCCICGFWIEPGSKWHLDHTEDRTGYRGAAHGRCNVRDGASRGARRANASRRIEKSCASCGQAFVTSYPKQRYCSRECRPKPEGKRVGAHCKISFMNCAACGALFAARPPAMTCSRACGYAFNKACAVRTYRLRVGIPLDAPAGTRAETYEVECVECDTSVTAGSQRRLYCSRRCQKRAYKRRQGEGGSRVHQSAA